MHGHGNKVGEGLVIEDREQAEQDHLDGVAESGTCRGLSLGIGMPLHLVMVRCFGSPWIATTRNWKKVRRWPTSGYFEVSSSSVRALLSIE
jgi:hypothetical protein